MSGDDAAAMDARGYMPEASGNDLAGFDAQLASTAMFFTPAEALEFTTSETLPKTMQYVAEFSFEHGLLGEGAPDAGFIGIEMPAGNFGDTASIGLRFDPSYMQMAADGML